MKLRQVEIADGAQVVPLGEAQRLNRLQGFDRQALGVFAPQQVAAIRFVGGFHRLFGERDLLASRFDAGVSLDNLARDAIQRGYLPPAGLLDAGLRFRLRRAKLVAAIVVAREEPNQLSITAANARPGVLAAGGGVVREMGEDDLAG